MTPAGKQALWIAAAFLFVAVVGRGEGKIERGFEAAGDDGRLEVRIDLNGAGIAELESLPGIGPALAARIEDLRRREGPFRQIEGLREVSGIGPMTVEALMPFLAIETKEEFSVIGE